VIKGLAVSINDKLTQLPDDGNSKTHACWCV